MVGRNSLPGAPRGFEAEPSQRGLRSAAAITEALQKVYGQDALVRELTARSR
jgi:hypothetical protein